ncbi:MAG: amidophosphoribosyltransferase, partial [Candidatus Dadabacteria bacterium]
MIPKTDKFKEECALIAIWNREEAANLAYLGLYAQQHRGQEGAGIVAFDQNTQKTTTHRGVGLVSDVFHNFDFSRLPGSYSIGHVRYSTAGESRLAEVQPFTAETSCGYMALAQNGNLVNADILRKELIKEGSIFSSTSDTEIILHLIAKEAGKASPLDSVIAAAKKIKGAFSLLIQFGDRLIALRDPNGFRPLSIAELDGGYILASETCAFDLLGAKYIRDLKAGEVLEIDALNNIESFFPFPEVQETPCIVEFVYFSRPDSFWYGESVHNARKKMGKILAREAPVAADLVIPVPDSGVSAALGYAEEAGLPFEIGLIRNHYVGRTFIEPKQSIRDFGAKVK